MGTPHRQTRTQWLRANGYKAGTKFPRYLRLRFGIDPATVHVQIPGSFNYRNYCPDCGTPMRVDSLHEEGVCCEDCSPPHRYPGGTSDSGPLDEDAGSYGAIARRYLEDPRSD